MQPLPTGLGASALTLDKIVSGRTIAQKGQQQAQGRRLSVESKQPRNVKVANQMNLGLLYGNGFESQFLGSPDQSYQGDGGRETRSLPPQLYDLVNPSTPVQFPQLQPFSRLDNRELDKLVLTLGKNKLTWRRALLLFEWLVSIGHLPDDRLCTTLIRVCGQHGQVFEALRIYDKMKASRIEGGLGLTPTVYTYTAAMRAALNSHMFEKAAMIWEDALRSECMPDCRLATTYMEVCSRMGNSEAALKLYEQMKQAPPSSNLAPSVHAYTAAMRAAAEAGQWERAMGVWQDMEIANCSPTGHAYAAIISACKIGGKWEQALQLFQQMMKYNIAPDVVSCTALVDSLAAAGQWQLADQVVQWMLDNKVSPNVRTYTALMSAFANAREWERAFQLLAKMYRPRNKDIVSVKPNAYTYSALLKALGIHGEWQLAELVFVHLEAAELGSSVKPEILEVMKAAGIVRESDSADISVSGRSFEEKLAALATEIQGISLTESSSPPSRLISDDLVPDSAPRRAIYGTDVTALKYIVDQGLHQAEKPLIGKSEGLGLAQSQSLARGPSVASMCALDSIYGPRPVGEGLTSGKASISSKSLEILVESIKFRSRESRLINEVICGNLMLAYERSGKWEEVVKVLFRANHLRITPNTVMYNTAISAAGKAGQLQVATTIFATVSQPDIVTFECMMEAYGRAGNPQAAETLLTSLLQRGMVPRDYAFVALITAYGLMGDLIQVANVLERLKSANMPASIHIHNAVLHAYVRNSATEQAVQHLQIMQLDGVEFNAATLQIVANSK